MPFLSREELAKCFASSLNAELDLHNSCVAHSLSPQNSLKVRLFMIKNFIEHMYFNFYRIQGLAVIHGSKLHEQLRMNEARDINEEDCDTQ